MSMNMKDYVKVGDVILIRDYVVIVFNVNYKPGIIHPIRINFIYANNIYTHDFPFDPHKDKIISSLNNSTAGDL